MISSTVSLPTDNLSQKVSNSNPNENSTNWAAHFVYPTILLLGGCGNCLVILVILRTKHLRTRVNVLLVNLAVADCLSLLVCSPGGWIEATFKSWPFPDIWCPLSRFFENFTTAASSLIIVIIGLERFLVIWLPLHAPAMLSRKRMRVTTICVTWISAVVLASPFFVTFQVLCTTEVHESYGTNNTVTRTICKQYVCESLFSSNSTSITNAQKSMSLNYLLVFTVLVVYVPLIILCVLYFLIMFRLTKDLNNNRSNCNVSSHSHLLQRRRVVFLAILVTVLYFVCVAPLRTLYFCAMISDRCLNSIISLPKSSLEILTHVLRVLFQLNYCINPIVYNLASARFRQATKQSCLVCFGMAGGARSRGGYADFNVTGNGNPTQIPNGCKKRQDAILLKSMSPDRTEL